MPFEALAKKGFFVILELRVFYRFEWHAIHPMFYVYILRSISHPYQVYVGFSENVRQRLKDHNAGLSTHTAKYKPWKLETCLTFDEKQKALDFERYLKTASGIAFRRKRL